MKVKQELITPQGRFRDHFSLKKKKRADLIEVHMCRHLVPFSKKIIPFYCYLSTSDAELFLARLVLFPALDPPTYNQTLL